VHQYRDHHPRGADAAQDGSVAGPGGAAIADDATIEPVQYLAKVLELERRCYADLRQTLFFASSDCVGAGAWDAFENFRALIRTSNWESIGGRAAASFALTPPAAFSANLFSGGTANPLSGRFAKVYSGAGHILYVGTLQALFESVHSCILAAP
jgi:hypothetical protein